MKQRIYYSIMLLLIKSISILGKPALHNSYALASLAPFAYYYRVEALCHDLNSDFDILLEHDDYLFREINFCKYIAEHLKKLHTIIQQFNNHREISYYLTEDFHYLLSLLNKVSKKCLLFCQKFQLSMQEEWLPLLEHSKYLLETALSHNSEIIS